ncbi:MAG: hypothetical protein HYU64_19835 [Armatimonadetes bacterium]|nr:hypothetical protein [Armatimonadota bacterium]
MNINPIYGTRNLTLFTLPDESKAADPSSPKDKDSIGPGTKPPPPPTISCYLVGPLWDVTPKDPEGLGKMRQDAIARAVDEGTISAETANKLR